MCTRHDMKWPQTNKNQKQEALANKKLQLNKFLKVKYVNTYDT